MLSLELTQKCGTCLSFIHSLSTCIQNMGWSATTVNKVTIQVYNGIVNSAFCQGVSGPVQLWWVSFVLAIFTLLVSPSATDSHRSHRAFVVIWPHASAIKEGGISGYCWLLISPCLCHTALKSFLANPRIHPKHRHGYKIVKHSKRSHTPHVWEIMCLWNAEQELCNRQNLFTCYKNQEQIKIKMNKQSLLYLSSQGHGNVPTISIITINYFLAMLQNLNS